MDLRDEISEDIRKITANLSKLTRGDSSGVRALGAPSKVATLGVILESVGAALGYPVIGSMLALAVGLFM